MLEERIIQLYALSQGADDTDIQDDMSEKMIRCSHLWGIIKGQWKEELEKSQGQQFLFEKTKYKGLNMKKLFEQIYRESNSTMEKYVRTQRKKDVSYNTIWSNLDNKYPDKGDEVIDAIIAISSDELYDLVESWYSDYPDVDIGAVLDDLYNTGKTGAEIIEDFDSDEIANILANYGEDDFEYDDEDESVTDTEIMAYIKYLRKTGAYNENDPDERLEMIEKVGTKLGVSDLDRIWDLLD
jgi:hypothetical protein